MNKTFICLANSYKHGNRCIAGVEIELYPQQNSYVVRRDANGNPIWFRPIHRRAEAGAIPNSEAQGISVLDIVKATQVEPCPDGAQKENFFYGRLERVNRVTKDSQNLDGFVDNTHHSLFGNRGAAVPPDRFVNLDYSVLLIKCTQVEFYMRDRTQWEEKPQPRGKLTYNGIEYDLPVTDPFFRQTVQNDLQTANSFADYYITLSLGVEHDEWHSKLIACVIPINRAYNAYPAPTQPLPQAEVPQATQIRGRRDNRREDSARITFDLFKQGLSIEDIAERRGLVTGTVGSHLLPFIKSGELNIRQIVSYDKIEQVMNHKRSHPEEDKLRPYFEAFNEKISFNEIKWVLAAIDSGQLIL